jgi:hypothetical protein
MQRTVLESLPRGSWDRHCLFYGLLLALRMWSTSVSESSVLRFFKHFKCIVIKFAADGKLCCVFLLMSGYNGKKPTQGPSLICLLPYGTDVTDGGFQSVGVVYGVCQWDIALDQSSFFDMSVLTCIFCCYVYFLGLRLRCVDCSNM